MPEFFTLLEVSLFSIYKQYKHVITGFLNTIFVRSYKVILSA